MKRDLTLAKIAEFQEASMLKKELGKELVEILNIKSINGRDIKECAALPDSEEVTIQVLKDFEIFTIPLPQNSPAKGKLSEYQERLRELNEEIKVVNSRISTLELELRNGT